MSADDLPIGIVRSLSVPGINSHAEIQTKPSLVVLPIKQALNNEWDTDALLVQYRREDQDGQILPDWRRCNKPSLTSLHEAGELVVSNLICLEWDNTPHEPWKSEEAKADFDERFTAALDRISQAIPSVVDWYAVYFTYQGFRAIWLLDQAAPVLEIEPKIRGLQAAFRNAGLPTDEKTADWTRLFRLPHATRPEWDKSEEGGEDLSRVLHSSDYAPAFNPDITTGLLLSEIPSVLSNTAERVSAEPLAKPLPGDEDCISLVWECNKAGDATDKLTSWGKQAKAMLTDRESYRALFADEPIAEVGGRDTTLFRYIGGVCGLLINMPDVPTKDMPYKVSPEHIYGLFLPAIDRLQEDSLAAGLAENWRVVCWKNICRLYPVEEKKRKIRLQEAEIAKSAKELSVQEKEDKLFAGMKKWCGHPDLWNQDRAVQVAFAKRHLIAAMGIGGHYYPLQPDGYYSYGAVSKDLLIGKLQSSGMDFLVDFYYETDNGPKKIPVIDFLNNNTTIIHLVRSELGHDGAIIKLMGTDEATLVQPMFRLNPKLKPTFDQDIHNWLLSFKSEKLLDWLALCIDFEKRLVMLSIAGPGSIGKSVLTQGVVECLENPIRATEKDLGKYSPNLLKTPFVIIDEGLIENASFGGKEISAAIREFLGGGEMAAERKFMATAGVVTKGRVLVMANNADVCAKLCGAGREQSKEDVEAIEMRTFHLEVTDLEPRKCLEKTPVDTPGSKWVYGNSYENDFRLAKHILWLNQNRKVPESKNRRFAMDGLLPPSIKKAMEKKTPNVDLCVEAIISMIEKPQPKEIADYMVIDEMKQSVFVVASSVFKAYEALGRRGLERDMSTNRIGTALAWLRKEGTNNKTPKVLTRKDGTRTTPQRWSEISFERLLQGATDYGFPATKLRKMFTGTLEVEEE